MVGFFGATELYDDEFNPEKHLLIGGGDGSSVLIREASSKLSSYSPRLDRDFSRFYAFDSKEAVNYISLMLGDTSLEWDLPVIYLGSRIVSPTSTRQIEQAYSVGVVPDERTVWYVGARDYSRMECQWARLHQRLLPIHEVDIRTALLTALSDLGGAPFRLMINMDVFDPLWAPAVQRPSSFGVRPVDLWRVLPELAGSPVEIVQICGLIPVAGDGAGVRATARLAAELGRDLALTCWPHKLLKPDKEELAGNADDDEDIVADEGEEKQPEQMAPEEDDYSEDGSGYFSNDGSYLGGDTYLTDTGGDDSDGEPLTYSPFFPVK